VDKSKELKKSRVGKIIGSSRFEEETRIYLQRRLRLLTTVVTTLFLLLSISFVISLANAPSRSFLQALVVFCTKFPNAVLFFLSASSSLIALVLWQKQVSLALLGIMDAVFLQVLMGPCLLLYARLHFFSFSGFAVVVPFLMLFILARAILIPSSALRTILLSLPAALGVFLIQLQAGKSFINPGQPFEETTHFSDMLIQNQILLLGSIAIAAVASRVNLGLRRQNFNARHIGQYKIERLLGEGGMGEVYQATHSMLKRPTAIKFLRPEITGRRTLLRFEKEVRHTSRLTHPNTISIYDYGHTADGIFFYAMELLRGANLRQIIRKTGPMPPSRVIIILIHACSALSEAHNMGIIHRDIKPENIMLCEQGGERDVVKILDFGLVKDMKEKAISADEIGSIAGTPETMPPEAQTENGIGPQSDLYSLCAVGCYILTGQPIFDAKDVFEFLKAHKSTPPIPPSQRRRDVPADLEKVLLSGLAKNPSHRPESALVMKEHLLTCRDAKGWDHKKAEAWWQANEKILKEDDISLAPESTLSMPKGTDVTITYDKSL